MINAKRLLKLVEDINDTSATVDRLSSSGKALINIINSVEVEEGDEVDQFVTNNLDSLDPDGQMSLEELVASLDEATVTKIYNDLKDLLDSKGIPYSETDVQEDADIVAAAANNYKTDDDDDDDDDSLPPVTSEAYYGRARGLSRRYRYYEDDPTDVVPVDDDDVDDDDDDDLPPAASESYYRRRRYGRRYEARVGGRRRRRYYEDDDPTVLPDPTIDDDDDDDDTLVKKNETYSFRYSPRYRRYFEDTAPEVSPNLSDIDDLDDDDDDDDDRQITATESRFLRYRTKTPATEAFRRGGKKIRRRLRRRRY